MGGFRERKREFSSCLERERGNKNLQNARWGLEAERFKNMIGATRKEEDRGQFLLTIVLQHFTKNITDVLKF